MSDQNATLQQMIKDHFGTQTGMAKVVGVTPQAVSDLVRRRGRIPAEWCIPIETATGGKVSRHELRPDIYPRN